MMKYLQKLGKALMLPVACLPICGILMGIGYALCPSTMQGGDVTGIVEMIGFFLVKAGGALIDNMAILFVIGVGVGMADDNDGTAGLAALASWLMMTNLLSAGVVTTLMPVIAENETKVLAFSKIANPFIGILAGIIGATCYNKFKGTKLPDWLSFFSGKRCVAIVAGVVSIIVSAILSHLPRSAADLQVRSYRTRIRCLMHGVIRLESVICLRMHKYLHQQDQVQQYFHQLQLMHQIIMAR
jgi:PTS system N-acetylglucosamine-specific IIC component